MARLAHEDASGKTYKPGAQKLAEPCEACDASTMKSVHIGGLEAIVIEVAKEAEQEIEHNVVLLHGYGAPGTDLVGLAREIPVQRPTRFVFFQAPHILPGLSGPNAGRAWWDIDMIQLQVIMMTRSYELLSDSHPPGLDEATDLLDSALSTLAEQTGVDGENTFVGGFSQGAMLTCNWALEKGRPLAGLIQLSGTVLRAPAWTKLLESRAGLPVFQSHSPDDQVLPYALAGELRGLFEGARVRHHWVSFRGGHGIGPEVLRGLGDFLSQSS